MSTEREIPVDKECQQSPQDTEVKLGPDGEGGYITPYKFTVAYNPESLFETAVATLCDQTQCIPVLPITNHELLGESCEHPSPEILLFGNKFSRESILKLFERGFQFVHIFTYSNEEAEKYIDTDEDVKKPFDYRTVTFDINTLYDHIILTPGLLSMYLLEHIICAAFPTYKSTLDENEITHMTGNLFCRGFSTVPGYFSDKLKKLCDTYKGFDIVHKYIDMGRTIIEERERLASERLENGIYYAHNINDEKYLIYAVSGCDLTNELLQLGPVHPKVIKPKCDYLMFYNVTAHTVENMTIPGWNIVLVLINTSAPAANEILRDIIGKCGGSPGVAAAWVPTLNATKLLTFIYPSSIINDDVFDEKNDN